MNDPHEVTLVCSDVRALRSRSESTGRQTALALAQLRQAIERRHLLLATCRQAGDAMHQMARASIRATQLRKTAKAPPAAAPPVSSPGAKTVKSRTSSPK